MTRYRTSVFLDDATKARLERNKRPMSWQMRDDVAHAARAERLHTVCAWCEAVIHQGERPEPVSHGICEACEEKVFEAKGVSDA